MNTTRLIILLFAIVLIAIIAILARKKETFVDEITYEDNTSCWNLLKSKYHWNVDTYDIGLQKVIMTLRKLDANSYNDDNKNILGWTDSCVIPKEHLPIFNKNPADIEEWNGLRYTNASENPAGYVIELEQYDETAFKALLTELYKLYDKEFFDEKTRFEIEIRRWTELKQIKELQLTQLLNNIDIEQAKLNAMFDPNSQCQKDRVKSEQLLTEYNSAMADKTLLEQNMKDAERIEVEKIQKERLAREQQEREQNERDRFEKEQFDKEQQERERSLKDQLERDRLEREKIAREKQAREQQERDRLLKEQQARDALEKEKLIREQLARDQAERERLLREKQEHERLQREKEQAELNRLQREKQARDQAERERLLREQAEKNRLQKEQQAREQQAREQAERDRLIREQQARDQEARDRLMKEQQAREQAAREQAAREKQAREQARLAQQARDAIHPPNSVVLFEGEHYTGASSVKGIGGYGTAALGVRNDHVRSIRVTPGMQVMIYEHEGRGYQHLITEDTPVLPGYWKYMVSSVVVYKR